MTGATRDAFNPQTRSSGANRDAVIASPDAGAGDSNIIRHLNMNSISIRTVPRCIDPHSLDFHCFTSINHNMIQLTVHRWQSTYHNVLRITELQRLQNYQNKKLIHMYLYTWSNYNVVHLYFMYLPWRRRGSHGRNSCKTRETGHGHPRYHRRWRCRWRARTWSIVEF